AVAGLLVDGAVLQIVLAESLALVAAVVPGRAVEAEGLRPGVAALDLRRGADPLAIGLALPRALALVGDPVAHFNCIGATADGVGAVDAHAVRADPGKRNLEAVLAVGQGVLARGPHRLERALVGRGRRGAADPAAL